MISIFNTQGVSDCPGQMLQHGVNNNDDRLNEITVKGNQIFSENGRPRTRSAKVALPDQWMQGMIYSTILPSYMRLTFSLNQFSFQSHHNCYQNNTCSEC